MDTISKYVLVGSLDDSANTSNKHAVMLRRQIATAKELLGDKMKLESELVFIIKEITRIESANSDATASTTLNILKGIIADIPKIMEIFYNPFSSESYCSDIGKFTDFANKQFQLADSSGDVFEHTRNILTWPTGKNAPWVKCNNASEALKADDNINKLINTTGFQLKLVDGEVYAVPDRDIAIAIFDSIGWMFDDHIFNSENYHINVISSNIVSDIAKAEGVTPLLEFINKFNTFTVTLEGVLATFSEVWPLFGSCAVVEVHSEYLNLFVRIFNEYYASVLKYPINNLLCIAFAIQERIIR